MKVLHFKTTYLNLSETFINRLVRNHIEFEPVVATAFKNKYSEDLNVYEMPKKGLKGLINRSQLIFNQSPLFLNSVIQKEKPDVIHGHFGLDSYRLLSVASRWKLPFIVNFYGHDVVRLPQEFGWKSRYKILREKADYFIAVSEDMKRNVTKLGFPEDRIDVIRLGVDMNRFEFQHRTSSKMNLMMIGRMVEKKGFEYALKAVSILKKQGYPVHLDIYGDGPLHSALSALCGKFSIRDQVTFNGNTENDAIINQLYKHDVLLTPSVQSTDGDREGLPMTIVEGMASGIPMIGSSHAGIPELIIDGETGLLTDEKDADGIARAIVRMYKNPELVSRISRNGREKVVKDHNIHTIALKTEALYHKVIKSYSNELV